MKASQLFRGIAVTSLMVLAAVSCSQNKLNTPEPVRGETSSSGGGIYEDGLNPWFLENTEAVSYCVEADASHFHLSLSRVEEIVKAGIDSWKLAFTLAPNDWYSEGELEPYGQVRLATQNFVKEDCKPTTLLRFQFGILSKEQQEKYISDPKQVVAEAVRTHYDKTNLRGRGFIYVSPDSGPLHPIVMERSESPWAFHDGALLKRVLLHELGHIFGLPHSGGAYDLMGAGHPEFLVQKSTIENLKKSKDKEIEGTLSQIGVFGYAFPSEREVCEDPNGITLGALTKFDGFFGIPRGIYCRKIKFMRDSVEVYASSSKDGEYEFIGRTKTATPARFSKALSRIKISNDQKVFRKLPTLVAETGYLDGPASISRLVFKSVYESKDGKSSGYMKATFYPNQLLDLEVVWNNEMIQLFDHGG